MFLEIWKNIDIKKNLINSQGENKNEF